MDILEQIAQFATQEQATTLLEVEYAQPVRSPTILTASPAMALAALPAPQVLSETPALTATLDI
jgi:hypothetical protein